MPPEPGITLSTERVNELRSFMKECHAKYEYRKASAIVMRAGGSGVRDVAATHGVSEKTVSVWTAAYMGKGVAGLKSRKRKRVLSSNGMAAGKRIPQLLCHEPAGFSIWRGRWTIGGMAMQPEKEGHACERIDCKEGAHREEMRLEETELGTVPTRVTDLHLEGQLDRVRSEDVRLQPAGRWVGGVAVVVPVEPI